MGSHVPVRTGSLDGRLLLGSVNTDGTADGDVDDRTTFRYHEDRGHVWAEYAGGAVVRGRLVGTRTGDTLDFRYVHLTVDDTTASGHCTAELETLPDGRVRSVETWEWESREGSGHSVVEEPDVM